MNTADEPIFLPDGQNTIHDGIEHEPTGGKGLIDTTDCVMLLLDHQSGLFQNVKDISVAELRANTTALAKLAALLQNSAYHDRFGSRWAKRTADARNSRGCSSCRSRS